MKRWQKWVAGLAGFFVLCVGFIAFVLPGIVRSKAIEGIEGATGRKAAISRIAINPLTWTVRVEGFRLREKGSDVTFASFSSVRVNLSARSLLRLAPIINEAQVTAPYLHMVRTAANTYNFSDLLEGKEKKKEPAEKPLRFSLNNITIANGSVDFIDQAIPVEKRHTLRRIGVGIPFVSNIPYLADRYVIPHFGAVINGSPFELEGKLKPFVKGAEMAFAVDLKELSLPFYFSYYPGTPPVQMDSGRLSTKLEVVYRVTAQDKPELEVKGDAVLADLKMRDRLGAPLAALTRGEVKISRARVMARDFAIAAVGADGLELYLARDRQGVWNFQRLAAGGKTAAKEETLAAAPSPATSPPATLVRIADIRLGGRLHLTDSLPPEGFSTDLTDLAVAVKGFSTAPGEKGTFDLSFATARGEKGAVKGDVTVEPLAVSAAVEVKELLLDACYPYLAGVLTAPIKGRLAAAAELTYTAAAGLKLAKGNLEVRQLAVPFGKEDGVKLARLAVKGVRADLKERIAEVEGVTLRDGTVSVTRAADGSLSPLALLREKNQAVDSPPEKKENAAPFRYRLKGVTGSGLNVTFADRLKEDEPVFRLRKMDFSITDVNGPRFAAMPFRIAAGYGDNGSIKASGTLNPSPLKLKGECVLQGIPLADFDPYLPENLNVTLADGTVDTKLAVNLAQEGGNLAGSFRGGIGVRSFYALDAADEDLLKWESLQMDNLRGTLNPFSLEIGELALNKFYSRIVVEKDGILNLKQLYTAEQKAATPQQPSSPPPLPRAAPAPGAEKDKIRIDLVTLQDGVIAFADRHTTPEFSSTMVNLGGRVSGLSSAANRLADVDLRGNLGNHSPLSITGQINPLRDDLFVDLKVSFADIELSPLTPYSGTFLGYSVDKGKLFLDLKYHIENKKLDSENKVFFDQLTFGGKVESDKATSLPVRLAVALLKDRKGEIHLDLPVTGRTDDPEFSVWRVVLQMLRNLLAKASTAPFALLQSAFGGKEDFSGVQFASGTARLSDAEREKLGKLARAIHDRPALKLELSGFVDRVRDPEGYRHELLLRKMKNEKFLAMVKEKKTLEGQGPESMEILPPEQSVYLKAAYRKEKFPKPRNVIGLVKDLPDDEMKKLILAHTAVTDSDLQNLARERAVTVRDFLIGEKKLLPEQIFEKKSDIFKLPARVGEAASRVEFGIAVN